MIAGTVALETLTPGKSAASVRPTHDVGASVSEISTGASWIGLVIRRLESDSVGGVILLGFIVASTVLESSNKSVRSFCNIQSSVHQTTA